MTTSKATNVTWHGATITTEAREAAFRQKGCVVWLTGLSASGKSTIARRAEELLLSRGALAYVLDGDNLRMGLNKDLGFSPTDRAENIRRVGCVAQLFADAGIVCITAFISPYRADRDQARAMCTPGRFHEVFVATSLEACESRDPKGLYKKARAGQIPDFTGISAPYEFPEVAELRLETENRTVDECAEALIAHLRAAGLVKI